MTYPDDHRRHHLQGAGAGDPRRRSSPAITPISSSAASTAAGPKDDSFYIYLGGLIGGGWGAKHDSDGVNATIAINDGDTHNGPSEQVEAKYPLLVERYALRPDSGGAGRFRGGLGTEQVVQARHDIRFNVADGPGEMPALGPRMAGCPASGNARRHPPLRRRTEQRFPNGKALNQVLHAGDAYILRSGGGGGFGSPLERDLASARARRALRLCQQGRGGKILRRGVRARDEQDRCGGERDPPRRDAPAGPAAGRADRRYRRAGTRPGTSHAHDHAHEQLSEEERVALAMTGRCCS